MPTIPIFGGTTQGPSGISQLADSSQTPGAYMGAAEAGMGKALVQLGNTLDEAGKKNRDDQEKTVVEIARGQFNLQATYAAKNKKVQMPDPNDPSGVNGAKDYQGQVDGIAENIASSLPDSIRPKFLAAISEDRVKHVTLTLADEVDKQEKINPVLLQQATATLTQQAFQDPAQYQTMALRGVDLINGSTTLPDAAKPIIAQKFQKDHFTGTLQGFFDRGDAGDPNAWAQAKSFVKSQAPGIFNSEEFQKLDESVDTAKNDYNNRVFSDWAHKKEQADYKFTITTREKFRDFTTQLQIAGSDQTKINLIQKQVNEDKDLTGEQKATLMNMQETTAKISDASFMVDLYNKAYRANADPTALMADIRRQAGPGIGKVTAPTLAKAEEFLGRLMEEKKNGNYNLKVLDNEMKRARDLVIQKQPFDFMPGNIQGRAQGEVTIDNLQSDILQAFMKNPGVNPKGTADKVYNSQGISAQRSMTQVDGFTPDQINTPEKIDQAIINLRISNKAPGASPAVIKQNSRRINQLLLRKKDTNDNITSKESAQGAAQSAKSTKAFDDRN